MRVGHWGQSEYTLVDEQKRVVGVILNINHAKVLLNELKRQEGAYGADRVNLSDGAILLRDIPRDYRW